MQELIEMTADEMRNLKGFDRFHALSARSAWLERQRKQDRKENHRIECRVSRLKQNKRG